MARAVSSLPEPLSPSMSTGTSVGATWSTVWSISLTAGERPTMRAALFIRRSDTVSAKTTASSSGFTGTGT